MTNMSKLTCKRSIKPFMSMCVLYLVQIMLNWLALFFRLMLKLRLSEVLALNSNLI